MPTGNLPDSGKRLYERVYKEAKANGDSEETAAKKAWGAVKQAGWYKDENGQWKKKAETVEFSLSIKKASFDPATGERRWRADTSDIDEDSHGDSMSMELFQDFLSRIERNEEPIYPEFKSEFWSGGMPYLSVSHYPDLDGKAVPGPVDAVFIDGKFFRAKGRFSDTPLGVACWKAIKADLERKSTAHDPVRISIAFLDYKHTHKDTGYVFERKADTDDIDICPECLIARLKGEFPRVIYQKGLLIHLAMTRVPVNKRTLMEVDKSMTTRKDDAASIVGEELAEEIETKAEMIGKSEALVIKADDDVEEVEAPVETVEAPAQVLEEKSNTPTSLDPENAVMDALLGLSRKMDLLIEALSTRSDAKKKEDEMEDDEEDDMEDEEEMKKKKDMKKAEVDDVEPVPQIDLVSAFSEAVAPITQRLDMLIAAQSPHKAEVPARRSISPATVQQVARSNAEPAADPSRPISISEYARRSVGLTK